MFVLLIEILVHFLFVFLMFLSIENETINKYFFYFISIYHRNIHGDKKKKT